MRPVANQEISSLRPILQSSLRLGAELFSISSMEIADVGEVCAIENTIYDFPWTSGNFIDSLNAGYTGSVVRSAGNFETERVEPAVIAYAMTMKLPDEVHLLNISVAKTFQGRGIGRAYLRALVNDARQQNAEGMLLEVRPSNAAAIKLYRSEGFSQVGLRKGYYPRLQNQREDAMIFLLAFNSQ
jgi:[ribosomal protein S18]-alanine N-acetyltransferase